MLKEEWVKKTGDSAVLVTRLKSQLREQRELQEKLVTAYLMKDKGVMPVFDRMNAKLEQDIAALEDKIAESEIEKATFEELLEFS